MIYTVTLNPAIDRTVHVEEINQSDVTRVLKTFRQPAGKGVNISLILNKLNESNTAVTLLAGDNGRYIEKGLDAAGINQETLYIDGNTRENIKIVPNKGSVLEINESGPITSEKDLELLIDKLKKVVKKGDIMVFTGSIPRGLPSTTYQTLIKEFKALGVITALDASGDNFTHGIKAKPTIIKPNKYELETHFKVKLNTNKEIITYGKKLLESGIEYILITLGKNGSLCLCKEIYQVEPLNINAINTVGAGDSFLAGFIYGFNHQLGIQESLKTAAAMATSSVLYEGTGPKDISNINDIKSTIIIKEI